MMRQAGRHIKEYRDLVKKVRGELIHAVCVSCYKYRYRTLPPQHVAIRVYHVAFPCPHYYCLSFLNYCNALTIL